MDVFPDGGPVNQQALFGNTIEFDGSGSIVGARAMFQVYVGWGAGGAHIDLCCIIIGHTEKAAFVCSCSLGFSMGLSVCLSSFVCSLDFFGDHRSLFSFCNRLTFR